MLRVRRGTTPRRHSPARCWECGQLTAHSWVPVQKSPLARGNFFAQRGACRLPGGSQRPVGSEGLSLPKAGQLPSPLWPILLPVLPNKGMPQGPFSARDLFQSASRELDSGHCGKIHAGLLRCDIKGLRRGVISFFHMRLHSDLFGTLGTYHFYNFENIKDI